MRHGDGNNDATGQTWEGHRLLEVVSREVQSEESGRNLVDSLLTWQAHTGTRRAQKEPSAEKPSTLKRKPLPAMPNQAPPHANVRPLCRALLHIYAIRVGDISDC